MEEGKYNDFRDLEVWKQCKGVPRKQIRYPVSGLRKWLPPFRLQSFGFRTEKQGLKMSGLDLSADRSGKRSDAASPVLSKKGKADPRYALFQTALIASSRNRDFIFYYTNGLRGREKEKSIRTKMRVKPATTHYRMDTDEEKGAI